MEVLLGKFFSWYFLPYSFPEVKDRASVISIQCHRVFECLLKDGGQGAWNGVGRAWALSQGCDTHI